jgi:protein TonB
MKPILTLFAALSVLTLLGTPAKAQKESFYLLDNNWSGTASIENAHYLLRVVSFSDTCWQFDYYNFTGPLIRSVQYRDKKGEMLHGSIRYYNAEGWMDSIGSYSNGKMHGSFYKLGLTNDTMRYHTKYVYENDQLVKTYDLREKHKDSLNADEKESEYPGGLERWGKFLNKNLQYPERAIKGVYQGTVCVSFMVDMDGRVGDAFVDRSVEYSLDAETIRIIKKSGKWNPATRNGQPLNSFKRQPITYRLQ